MTIRLSARFARGCVALAALCLVSCAGSKGKSAGGARESEKVLALSEGAGAAALEKRYAIGKDDVERGEDGTFKGGKRSQFEGKKNVSFGGGLGTASYRKKEYNGKRWSGNTAAQTNMYGGNTDGSRFQTSSRFQGTSAAHSGRRSRFDGSSAATSRFKTGSANEASRRSIEKPSDAKTDFRRRVYPEPPIMTEEEYRKMTVEQTRSILGRDD